jgi:Ca-activated chloride channel family protein
MVNRPSTLAAGLLVVAVVALAGCSAADRGASESPAFAPGGGAAPSPLNPNVPADGETPGAVSEVDPRQQPLSTFALDVDTASYGYARRLLTDGRRPDRSSIRPEEFVNAFGQDYRQPTGNGFTVSADGARFPEVHENASSTRLLRIGLQTRREDPATRPDAVLTFVVDVSGSMAEKGKLDLVQDALRALVDQLRPADRVAIVSYSDRAKLEQGMTAGRNRTGLHNAIDNLRIAGSTNLEEGLVKGYEVARGGFVKGSTNRVILLSDGLPNVGSTNVDSILRQIREAAAKEISLLGVGVGSDYGDKFMERLADQGDGFVVYVSEPEHAKRVFVEQLPANLAVRALDAKAQVEFNPEAVAAYRLIGYDNRALAASEFRNDNVDGGEVGPGHSVTALYTVRLRGEVASADLVATARVRWQDPSNRQAAETSGQVRVGDLQRQFDAASARLKVCYAAAFFAEVLRGSEYGHQVRLPDLAEVADEAASETDDPDVTTLARLIRKA